MRLPKWFRSVRGKPGSHDSSLLAEEVREFGERTLQTKTDAISRRSATEPSAVSDGKKGGYHRSSKRPTPNLSETPTPDDFKHRAVTHTFTPPNSPSGARQRRLNSAYSHGCPVHGLPRDLVERCTCPGLSPPGPEAAVDAPAASLSLFYATRGRSQESVSSKSVSSIDPFSELAAHEASIMEQRHIRALQTVARSIALDPLFQTPLGVDSMVSPRAPEPSQRVEESIFQHANDLQQALSANLNFNSLSAAWRRGLQAPIESSA